MTGQDEDRRNLRDADARIMFEILEEYRRATRKFKPFNSAHEGYAVMLEELDELWEVVRLKKSQRKIEGMREEAIQVAAMALRFVYDVCDREKK